jgi:hypothetical protein
MQPYDAPEFWNVIDTLNECGLLPHLMIIGSWSEYVYSQAFDDKLLAGFRTQDMDILIPNIRVPRKGVNIYSELQKKGFVYQEDTVSGIGHFFGGRGMEVEFLARALGQGDLKIAAPCLNGLVVPSIRSLDILTRHPLPLAIRGYTVIVPEPAAYVLHKLLINSQRKPAKQKKDLGSIRSVLAFIVASDDQKARLGEILGLLSNSHQKRIRATADGNNISLPI